MFAAASLTDAFTALAAQFEQRNPQFRVELSYGGSQQLAHQINEGAPADVFASANQRQMAVVVEGGQVDPDAPRTFVTNRLVVAFPPDNPAQIRSMPDLARPGLKIVMAAKEVPAGQYTLDMLAKASQDASLGPGYADAVLKNVISYEDNIRSALNKVALGEADAAVAYYSDVVAAGKDKVGQMDIPADLNITAEYPIAVLKNSPQAAAAQAFVDYVLSAEGQRLLADYGFLPNR